MMVLKVGRCGCMVVLPLMMMYLHDAYGFEEKATLVDSADSKAIQVTYVQEYYSRFNMSFNAQVIGSTSFICYPSKWLTSENGEELQIPEDDAAKGGKKMLKEGARLEKGETGWLRLDVLLKRDTKKVKVEKVEAWFHVKNVGKGRAMIRVEEAERMLKRVIESCLRENLMRSSFGYVRARVKASAKRGWHGREEEVWYELVHVQLERGHELGRSILTLSMQTSNLGFERLKRVVGNVEHTYEKEDWGTMRCEWRVKMVSEGKARNVLQKPALQLHGLANSRSFTLTAHIIEGEAQTKVLLGAAYGLLRLKESLASHWLPIEEWHEMLKRPFKATILDGDESHTFSFEISQLMLH